MPSATVPAISYQCRQTTFAANFSRQEVRTLFQIFFIQLKLIEFCRKLQKSQNSPKKKTPGRRKTPKSAKRQLQLQQSKLNQPKSSKRALFTSPVQPKVEDSQPSTSNSASTLLSNLTTRLHKSKRALFSPNDGSRKRNRTDSVDSDDSSLIFGNLLKPTKRTKIENSPNKFLRSFSFSVAGANSSGSASDSGGLHRRSLFRTQSECISQQSQQSSQSSVGFRQPLTEEHKRVSFDFV